MKPNPMSEQMQVAEKLAKSGLFAAARQNATDSMLPHTLPQELARRNHLAPFEALQMQLPGLPILPVPDFSRLVIATSANYVEEVPLRGNVQLLMCCAFTTGIFFLSFGGRCILPPVSFSNENAIDQIVGVDGKPFYTKGLQSVSIGIVNNGDVVSVIGWTQIV